MKKSHIVLMFAFIFFFIHNTNLKAQTSSICGMKFNDLNGNGVLDPGEPGLQNWEINIKGLNSPGSYSVFTDVNGNYCFDSLKAGETYTISENSQSGWTQTYPASPGTYTITLANGEHKDSVNFGNHQNSILGSICGMKFNDLNGNGVKDPGEPGLQNWVINLTYQDAAGSHTISDTTDINGNYCFENLQPGPNYFYHVSEVNQSGWQQTAPSQGTYNVYLTDNHHIDYFNFGNHQQSLMGSLCGIKFNDLNGNGIQDPGESGLQNWVINLKFQNAAGFTNLYDTTDSKGNFCFDSLQPGVPYTISEVNQSGWTQTYPAAPGTYTITLASGQNIDTLKFGNHAAADSAFCTDFEDGNSGGWQGSNIDTAIKLDGSNHYLETTDKSGPSFLYNTSSAYTGDWSRFFNNGCGSLCWDINYFNAGNGNTTNLTLTPYIAINDAQGDTAYFAINSGPITASDGWHSYCAPLNYANTDGSLPSNSYGQWVLKTTSLHDWNTLISNVTRVWLPCDPYNYSETIGYDNICIRNTGDCNPPISLCDSLKAAASKTSATDCSWSLSLLQPVNLSGVFAIKIECLSPNQFTTGTGLGTNFQNWFTSANTYYPPTSDGKVPGGNINNFFNMNILYTTSPQLVVVTWLDSLGGKVCSDTLKLDCQISCTTILNDTLTCNNNGYTFSYKFTNNATYGISNIEYTLQSPSGVTISPAADTLSPELGAGSTSSFQNIQISGGMPGDTVKIVAKFISSGGCCWCFETFTVILPSCATVCDSLGVSASGSKEDCCYSISLTNNSSLTFSSVQFQLLSGGMFSTIGTTSVPGWAFTNVSPNNQINLVKLPFSQGIGNGTFNNILDMCIRQYPDSNQVIEVRWIKDGTIVCRDTLRFVCIETSPKTDTCSQVIDGAFTCLPDGKVQYVFRVQNNSIINSTGFGIFPMTPGVTFSKTIFNNVNILPGQVSPLDTIIISGIGSNNQVCLQTSIFVTVDSLYNYCCHSDTVCLTTPDCGTKDSLEACITWDLMNDTTVTSLYGNVHATGESISAGSTSPFMGIFNPYTTDGQRLLVFGGWPAGSLDPTRYIEFKAAPNSGNSYTVKSVSFNYGDSPQPADFNIIKSQVFYSTNNFSNSTSIGGTLNYSNISMSTFNVSNLNVFVGNGQTFSLRIYPYSPTGSISSTVSLAIHNNVVICGMTSSVTSIDDGKTGNIIPKNYQLKQNFPNPFNPSSIIQYDIPKSGFVKISVYDVLGREVRVLVNEEKAPGSYNVVFDAKGLASGIYFYAIRTSDFNQIKKMILMK